MASQVESIKWVPGTRFIVDGFAFQSTKCVAYFLTHGHSDHTVGLTRAFAGPAPIYCSPVTANLLIHDMGIDPARVRPLPLHTPTLIEGVTVTLLDANHCPGAVMILFQLPTPPPPPLPPSTAPPGEPKGSNSSKMRNNNSGIASAAAGPAGPAPQPPRTILHTGDCRWEGWMAGQAGLGGIKVDTLFLDTTYCQPRYTFPPQAEAIAAMVAAMRQALAEQPATLFVVAAYHIGKERAFLGAAKALGLRVWCEPAKRRVLNLLGLPAEDLALLADSPDQAQCHVVSWGLRPEALEKYLQPGWACAAPEQQADGHNSGSGAADAHAAATSAPGGDAGAAASSSSNSSGSGGGGCWQAVCGFRPTGWSHRKKGGLSRWAHPGGAPIAVYGVPYSEHSSYTELRACVAALRPRLLVPTVNAATPAQARAIVDRFADLLDLRGDRSRMDYYLMACKASGIAVGGGGLVRKRPKPEGAEGTVCIDVCCPSSSSSDESDGSDCELVETALEGEAGRELLAHGRAVSSGKCSGSGTAQGAQKSQTTGQPELRGHGPPAAALSSETQVDLEQIDVGEQQRLWEAIQSSKARLAAAAAAATHKAGGSHKRLKQPAGSALLTSSSPAGSPPASAESPGTAATSGGAKSSQQRIDLFFAASSRKN